MDRSDNYPGHPDTIDCIVKIDEDTIITGSGDGIIRVVNIHPNKILGVIGEIEGEFPIKSLRKSGDNRFLGSIGDSTLKFWNLELFYNDEGDDSEEEKDNEEEIINDDGEEDDEEGGEEEEEEGGDDEIIKHEEESEEEDFSSSSSSEEEVKVYVKEIDNYLSYIKNNYLTIILLDPKRRESVH